MKRRMALKLIPFSVAACVSRAYAQSNDRDAVQLFNAAATRHRRELESMAAIRGVPIIIHLDNANADSIAGLLAKHQTEIPLDEFYLEALYPPGTAVLFYSYNEGQLYTWLLDEQGIQAYNRTAISTQQISQAVTNFRNSIVLVSRQLARTPFPRDAQPTTVNVPSLALTPAALDNVINSMTELLLPAPIATYLEGIRHLIIVPAFDIGTVPYAILQPFDKGSSLIEKMSISIAPSLFDLGQAILAWNKDYTFFDPLIVGNPYLPASSTWNVPTLAGAEQEAQMVASAINTTPLIGREATKAVVEQKASEASLLYFAAHGVGNRRNPLDKGLLMLSAETLEQGFWTAREIQSERLRAELAVLSACQTGLGQALDAGVIGLSRAFQIAGVPRVVMSLWSVDDEATSALMQRFVGHLANNFPSEALRLAMLEVKEIYPEPYKWASFTLFGTPR